MTQGMCDKALVECQCFFVTATKIKKSVTNLLIIILMH